MLFHLTPRPLAHLIATILLTPGFGTAVQLGRRGDQGAFAINKLFGRNNDCDGQLCGWNDQLCCGSGSACYTDSSDQAQCSTAGAVVTTAADGGYYSYYTTTYTDVETYTSTMSTYVAGATSATCNYALNETPCGDICCASGQYCYVLGQCADAGNGGSSGYYSSYYSTYYSTYTTGVSAGAPIAPTSSTYVLTTQTVSPTTTVPFQTPVATGANVTVTESNSGGGGLSGGAIAGIVIGVLAGLLLLGLLCFYCCLRGLWEGCLALFGLGGRRKRTVTETDVYERRSHHAGGGAGRTWYGAAAGSRPARVERRDDHSERNRILGIGAGLAGLAAVLGLKRRNDKREEEKSEYTYSSYDYTSASSASSDDRRTRHTGRSYSRPRP